MNRWTEWYQWYIYFTILHILKGYLNGWRLRIILLLVIRCPRHVFCYSTTEYILPVCRYLLIHFLFPSKRDTTRKRPLNNQKDSTRDSSCLYNTITDNQCIWYVIHLSGNHMKYWPIHLGYEIRSIWTVLKLPVYTIPYKKNPWHVTSKDLQLTCVFNLYAKVNALLHF